MEKLNIAQVAQRMDCLIKCLIAQNQVVREENSKREEHCEGEDMCLSAGVPDLLDDGGDGLLMRVFSFVGPSHVSPSYKQGFLHFKSPSPLLQCHHLLCDLLA